MAIVMGLDQHRAQITAEWIDTSTGEISRARVAPAHRAHVRRFLGRFGDQELEAALEATTGWRFVVEELRRVGARVHLAEPAETAARRGTKKRAKNDRADARHLRELLMVGRLPESWIPPVRRAACPDRDPRHCGGRCSRPPSARAGPARPTTTTTSRPHSGSGATARACRSHASCSKRSYHTLRELGPQAMQPA